MSEILVTGGAGFIGSHVCDKLLVDGNHVVCVDNLNEYYSSEIKKENIAHNIGNKRFTFYKVDITNYGKMRSIFEKHRFDVVIHLAARAGVRPSLVNPHIYQEVNVKGTLNLLELSKRFNVQNFVFGSSSSVYGVNRKIPFLESDDVSNQVSPYAVTKRAGELFCNNYHKLYGMNITCLRFFTVFGPRGRPDMAPYKFTHSIYNGLPVDMYGDGTSARDYTYVGDIVEGIIYAAKKPLGFEIINLGNSKPIQLKNFISVIESVVGKKALINRKEMPPGDVPITYADISKAKRLIGYNPKMGFEEGMRKFFEWYKWSKYQL